MLRDVPQEAAHDLAAPGLRQLRREDDVRRLRDRADLPSDVVAQLLELLDRPFLPALQRHERDDRLSGGGVVAGGGGGPETPRVIEGGSLPLARREAITERFNH